MHIRPLLATLAACAAVIATPSFGQATAPVAHRAAIVSHAALSAGGYGEYWAIDLGFDRRTVVDEAHLVDENLYLRTTEGVVYAIQADTGLLRWVRDLGEMSFRSRPPTHVQTDGGGGSVLFVTRSHVHAFDRHNGDVVGRWRLPFPAGGGAVADDYGVYLGGADGMFFATGWPSDCCSEMPVVWRAGVEGAVLTQPTLALDGRLFFASDEGVVYCVGSGNRRLYWSVALGGVVTGGLYRDETGVYVASDNRRLVVLNEQSGRFVKEYRFPEKLRDAPVVVQRTVYQYCPQDGLTAIDVDTRDRMWRMPNARRFVARAAERVVLMTESGDLAVADNGSGRIHHVIDLPKDTLTARNDRDAVVYLVSVDGRVLCAKPRGFPYMRRETILSARTSLGGSDSAGAERGTGVMPSDHHSHAQTSAADDPLRSGISR
jgi:outer membrane protein assembly factor BamB